MPTSIETRFSQKKIRMDREALQPEKITIEWTDQPLHFPGPKIRLDWEERPADFPQGQWHLPMNPTYLNKPLHLGAEQKRFVDLNFPNAGSYVSPTPAIFLHQIPRLEALNRSSLVIARDGSIPLFHFFEKFKKPKGLQTKIAIHEELLSCVPSSWHRKVVSYRLFSSTPESERKNLFIYGTNSAAFISAMSVENALTKLGPLFEEAEKIFLCLPSHFMNSHEPLQMHAEIARRIFAQIGTKIEICDWGQFMHQDILHSSRFINLNKNSLIADPWLSHALMQAGATDGSLPPQPNEKPFFVSLLHGFAVRMRPKFSDLQLRTRHLEKTDLMGSFEASVFNWKKIFSRR